MTYQGTHGLSSLSADMAVAPLTYLLRAEGPALAADAPEPSSPEELSAPTGETCLPVLPLTINGFNMKLGSDLSGQ